jgi:hypothetical protein
LTTCAPWYSAHIRAPTLYIPQAGVPARGV